MACGSCGQRQRGTVNAPRVVAAPLTAKEVADRMPRKPVRRFSSVNGSPRRTGSQ